MRLIKNAASAHNVELTATELEIVGREAPATVRPFIVPCPKHEPTPLVSLPCLAKSLGVAAIEMKDESQRFGLKSFKALGGAYAVARLVHEHIERRLGHAVDPADLQSEHARRLSAELTFCCATDGNHGRSVAAGARLFGCRCVIFLHEGVSIDREQAIADFGAEICRTRGNYDDSVLEASQVAEHEKWTTVSDFSWPGYERIPGLVMQGYTTFLAEIAEQMTAHYTHIFVQGGVGGLAAAVAGYFKDWLGADRPKLIVVEPEHAACLQASAAKGARCQVPAEQETIMAMLDCYEPSLIAWEILGKAADWYLDIPDVMAGETMRRLAQPNGSDPALVIGESGVAGLAGLIAVRKVADLWCSLALNEQSRVLVVGSEGATDPNMYQRLLREAEELLVV